MRYAPRSGLRGQSGPCASGPLSCAQARTLPSSRLSAGAVSAGAVSAGAGSETTRACPAGNRPVREGLARITAGAASRSTAASRPSGQAGSSGRYTAPARQIASIATTASADRPRPTATTFSGPAPSRAEQASCAARSLSSP